MRRTWGVRAVAVVGAILVGLTPVVTAQAQPNPYGRGSSLTEVALQADGSYTVRAVQTRELVREYELTFGGSVHDGFRLADDGSVIPPYLRATYEMRTAIIDTAVVTLPFTTDRHRVAAKSTQKYAAGSHTAEFDYLVRGAALPDRRGFTVHVRTLARNGDDTLTVDSSAIAGEVLGLRCVTYAPDSVPCGTRSGNHWTVQLGQQGDHEVPSEVVIGVRADSATVSKPGIDRS